ncbi:MAG: type II toxin-antitoxin system RelE family toxin [Limisphaerales bacterium]
MSLATFIHSKRFDEDFLKLPADVQARIEAKLFVMARRLDRFPHYQMTSSKNFRLRVGDHRIIYTYDLTARMVHLVAVGNRREIYR